MHVEIVTDTQEIIEKALLDTIGPKMVGKVRGDTTTKRFVSHSLDFGTLSSLTQGKRDRSTSSMTSMTPSRGFREGER